MHKLGHKWCKLPKGISSKNNFAKMFVKNAVDGTGKNGYDNITKMSSYAKL